jgi:hypothetical protein
MGHTRLGWIPKSKKWASVVEMVAGGGAGPGSQDTIVDDVAIVASATLEAAEAGLAKAIDDLGLRYTFYLLTQLVLAARKDDWKDSLGKLGIKVNETSTLFDLNAQFQSAVDNYVFDNYHCTDINEIAIKSAGEALTTLSNKLQINLFGNQSDEIKNALGDVSTKKGFSELGQKFFGLFMSKYLNFYLSRITAAKTGSDKLQQIGEVTKFNEVLQRHCEQSAKIVHDFCGQWLFKTEYIEGINLENTSRFMAVAIKKIQAELKQQRAEI